MPEYRYHSDLIAFAIKKVDGVRSSARQIGYLSLPAVAEAETQLRNATEEIPWVDEPKTVTDVRMNDAKRRGQKELEIFDHDVTGKQFTFPEIVDLMGLNPTDIDHERLYRQLGISIWPAREAIDRLHAALNLSETTYPILAIPVHQARAERAVQTRTDLLHSTLSPHVIKQLLADSPELISQAENFPNEVNAYATNYSYYDSSFYHTAGIIALATSNLTYMNTDRKVRINHRQMMVDFAHELGHGSHAWLTRLNPGLEGMAGVPSDTTISVEESIAASFEQWVPGIIYQTLWLQEILGINPSEQSRQIVDDFRTVSMHNHNYEQLKLVALGNAESLEDPKTLDEIKAKLREVSLNPLTIEQETDGLVSMFSPRGIHPYVIRLLRYSAREAVPEALEIFEQAGIHPIGENLPKIFRSLMDGFYSRTAFIELARIKAKEGIN